MKVEIRIVSESGWYRITYCRKFYRLEKRKDDGTWAFAGVRSREERDIITDFNQAEYTDKYHRNHPVTD